MSYQLPTYPNITATIGRPEDGLFCELTVSLNITADRSYILFAEVIDQNEPADRLQTLLDIYGQFILDSVELQLPFFRNVTEAEFEQILPPME
ncbi:hypothetical protein A7P95_00005 [Eikenella longinqua]|uniref:Uncharacterized protein n=2 Tax=Eikenella TaxID=538 RepID=A0A1A9S329_9NEIS|nr:hypothetical protein [Eikenella longinqua]OAM32221.1 hypothetical protein A7P95_00005 [Eikenella longinqua]